MPSFDTLVVRGAREHNLKNISVELPRDKLIVLTGLSGSGKSSLAFDTIYAEGQRRYVESLSAYARHTIEIVVDRLVKREGIERRLTDSVETALRLAEGVVEIEMVPREGDATPAETLTFSQHLACPIGHESYEELAPRNFSFNSP